MSHAIPTVANAVTSFVLADAVAQALADHFDKPQLVSPLPVYRPYTGERTGAVIVFVGTTLSNLRMRPLNRLQKMDENNYLIRVVWTVDNGLTIKTYYDSVRLVERIYPDNRTELALLNATTAVIPLGI